MFCGILHQKLMSRSVKGRLQTTEQWAYLSTLRYGSKWARVPKTGMNYKIDTFISQPAGEEDQHCLRILGTAVDGRNSSISIPESNVMRNISLEINSHFQPSSFREIFQMEKSSKSLDSVHEQDSYDEKMDVRISNQRAAMFLIQENHKLKAENQALKAQVISCIYQITDWYWLMYITFSWMLNGTWVLNRMRSCCADSKSTSRLSKSSIWTRR